MTLGLVACSAYKTSYAGKAHEVYAASQWFTKNYAAATKECDEVFIISAKHGVIAPNDYLEPYDFRLNMQTEEQRAEWMKSVGEFVESRVANGDSLRLYMPEDYLAILASGVKSPIKATLIPWSKRTIKQSEPREITIGGSEDPIMRTRGPFNLFVDEVSGVDSRSVTKEAPKDWILKWIWDEGPISRQQMIERLEGLGFSKGSGDYQWALTKRFYAHQETDSGLINKFKAVADEQGLTYSGAELIPMRVRPRKEAIRRSKVDVHDNDPEKEAAPPQAPPVIKVTIWDEDGKISKMQAVSVKGDINLMWVTLVNGDDVCVKASQVVGISMSAATLKDNEISSNPA